MTVLKVVNTNNGMAGAHRVVKAEIADGKLQLQVHMYLTAEDAANNQNLRWQEYPVLPLAALDVQDPWGSLERGLVAQVDGVLEGGTFVADVAADDLGTAKAVKWAEIKAIRDQLECGGFDLAGVGRFDSDEESRNKIIDASLAAKIARDAGRQDRPRCWPALCDCLDAGGQHCRAAGRRRNHRRGLCDAGPPQ